MTLRRDELKFQNHIMESYKNQGGHARKWASEWQKGMPDLICSLVGFGVHLIEVKHVPEFGPSKSLIINPLEPRQQHEAKKYVEGGGLVFAGIVGGSTNAIGSHLSLFHPLKASFKYNESLKSDFVSGKGYDMLNLMEMTFIPNIGEEND